MNFIIPAIIAVTEESALEAALKEGMDKGLVPFILSRDVSLIKTMFGEEESKNVYGLVYFLYHNTKFIA